MHTALRKAAAEALMKHHPTAKLPETREEFDAVLDALRPEGEDGRMWAGVRPAVAEHVRVRRTRPEFQTWFSAAAKM